MSQMRTLSALVVLGSLWSSTLAIAQTLGTFRWQLLPYCNVLTVQIAQQGAVYTLDGTDDRCEAAQAASARGMAFLNPNGTIGFGLTMVQPGGVPVHLEATISLPALNGTWRDSSGASGSLVLTPGSGIGGPPRLVGLSGVPPASITAVQLATSAVGAVAIAPNAVTGGHVVDGTLTRADIADAPRITSVESAGVALPSGLTTVLMQTTVDAPANGRVLVEATGSLFFGNVGSIDGVTCSLTTGAVIEPPAIDAYEQTATSYKYLPFVARRTFTVAAGASTTFRWLCFASGTNIVLTSPVLTTLFIAGP